MKLYKIRLAALLVLSGLATGAASAAGNLLLNGSFESGPSQPVLYWSIDSSAATLGTSATTTRNAKSGAYSLRLAPAPANPLSDRLPTLYGIAQAAPAASVAGKQVYVTAWMQAEGNATAVLRVYAFGPSGISAWQQMRQPVSSSGPLLRRDIVSIPADATFLIVSCAVAGNSGAAYFDDVSLTDTVPSSWLEAAGTPDAGAPLAASIAVNASRTLRSIPREIYGANLEWIWDGDGLWDPAAGALNSSILSLAASAGLRLYRFPGGVFSDFYHWRNGVGPMAQRPETESCPGCAVSANHFGSDEALQFASLTGGELMVTVNCITGSASEAADWVRYIASSGRRVRYWEIGNESYVPPSNSQTAASALTPEAYALRFVEFAKAMKAVDPAILVGAITDENYTRNVPPAYPDWTERILRIAGNDIDFLSIHAGYAPVIPDTSNRNARAVYSSLLASPQLIRDNISDLARRVDALVPARAGRIQIAVTEWGPAFQGSPGGTFLDHTKTLGSALFAAGVLKSFLENPRVIAASLFKLADTTPLGWIGPRKGAYAPKAALLALQMFSRNFGDVTLDCSATSPVYDTPAVGWVDSAGASPYLEAIASFSADRTRLYVLAINKHPDRQITARINIAGVSVRSKATVFTLNGPALDANNATELYLGPGITAAAQALVLPNSRFYAGVPDDVAITTGSLAASSAFTYTYPPHSITSIQLTVP